MNKHLKNVHEWQKDGWTDGCMDGLMIRWTDGG